MADALACVIIAFPVYLWVTRSILRQMQLHPEKLASSVRKWLTYIALLIAACIVIGDLITFLTYFLGGELTTRFVAKVTTVLVIAGGVFWYYFGSLRKADSIASPASASTGVKP
jgi:branched-subunit amino acid transport protein